MAVEKHGGNSMSGIIHGIMAYGNYRAWEESLHGKRAVDLGKNECTRCGACCARRPCIPTPTELEKIAEYLHMSAKEAIQKYFVIDRMPFHSEYFIFPAKKSQEDLTGAFVPAYRTFDEGYCIFFDQEKRACKIYPVRPRTAREQNCWQKDNGKATEQALAAWKRCDIKKQFNIDFNEE